MSPGWVHVGQEHSKLQGSTRCRAGVPGCAVPLRARYQSLGVIAAAGASDRLWFRESFDHATSAVGNAWFPLFRLTSLSSLSSS